MKKILISVALLAPVMLALSQNASAQANTLPPALPFDGHARGVDQSLPPPPPPPMAGLNMPSGNGASSDAGSAAGNLHVVLVMGPNATVEETDQGGKAVRTTTIRDGGPFMFKGKRYKAQVKDGEVSLADGATVTVLGSANSMAVDTDKVAATTAEQMSAGEGVHELKTNASVFSNSTGNSSNGNGGGNNSNNNSNGVSHF